jgi:hypothetical protein
MKISPKLKLNIIFWIITIPMIPFVVLLLLLALIISPIPVIGNNLLDKTERLITKFAIWRNNLPVVKNAYDKAHLFDYIKG